MMNEIMMMVMAMMMNVNSLLGLDFIQLYAGPYCHLFRLFLILFLR